MSTWLETRHSTRLTCLLTPNRAMLMLSVFTYEHALVTVHQLWFVAQCSTGREEKHTWLRKGWRFVVKALEAWLRLNAPSAVNAPRL